MELFQILFLAHLGHKLDKRCYAVKGGCNLRFFFKSIRYSEDIDLDIQTEPVEKLRAKVNGILTSPALIQTLKINGLALEHVAEAKQTATTQRWKLGLLIPISSLPLPTKIEFSRRGMRTGTRFESIDPELIRTYRLPPMLANHYTAEAAFSQKLEAVLSRRTPQARDIFDLHLLLRSARPAELAQGEPPSRLSEVQTRIMAVDFEVFKSQVLAFLPPDYQRQYDSRSVWEQMVLETVEALRGEPP